LEELAEKYYKYLINDMGSAAQQWAWLLYLLDNALYLHERYCATYNQYWIVREVK